MSGGAGPLHASAIARELSIPTVLVPPLPGHFSAWGMLLADIRFDNAQTFVADLEAADGSEIEAQFKKMEEAARDRLDRAAPLLRTIEISRFIDVRYAGQEHTVRTSAPVAFATGAARDELREKFMEMYAQRYGHADPRGKLQLVTLLGGFLDGVVEKPRLESFRPKSPMAAKPVTSRQAFFEETDWVECPVYSAGSAGRRSAAFRSRHRGGNRFDDGHRSGEQHGEIDELGNIVIHVASRHAVLPRQPESAGVPA